MIREQIKDFFNWLPIFRIASPRLPEFFFTAITGTIRGALPTQGKIYRYDLFSTINPDHSPKS
jgi:hypothetical protein